MRKLVILLIFFVGIIVAAHSQEDKPEIIYVQVSKENLRISPNGGEIGSLLYGTELKRLDEKGKWTKVQVEGWIWAESVAGEKPKFFRKAIPKIKEEKATLLNWSWEYKTLGENCFIDWRAEVRNNCSKTKAIEVKVSFYDSSGRVLAFHKRGIWSKVPPHGTDTIGGGMNYSCSKPKPTSAKARILDVSDPL